MRKEVRYKEELSDSNSHSLLQGVLWLALKGDLKREDV